MLSGRWGRVKWGHTQPTGVITHIPLKSAMAIYCLCASHECELHRYDPAAIGEAITLAFGKVPARERSTPRSLVDVVV